MLRTTNFSIAIHFDSSKISITRGCVLFFRCCCTLSQSLIIYSIYVFVIIQASFHMRPEILAHTHTHTAHPCKPMDYNNMSASEPTNMKHILQLANIQRCCALFFCYTTLLFVTCCCLEQPCTPCFAFVEALSLSYSFSHSLSFSLTHTQRQQKKNLDLGNIMMAMHFAQSTIII